MRSVCSVQFSVLLSVCLCRFSVCSVRSSIKYVCWSKKSARQNRLVYICLCNQNTTIMAQFKVGDEVVNTNSGYTAGRIGVILAIDESKQRAQVKWAGKNPTNWVAFKSIHLTSVPYTVLAPEKVYKNGTMIKFIPAKVVII